MVVLEYRRVEAEIYRSRLGKKFMTTPVEPRGLTLGNCIGEMDMEG